MEFIVKTIPIKYLVELIDHDKIDLKPSYQRNFIWTNDDQKQLIDSILKGYPLPNFFVYKRPDGVMEMVDGQQRARSIYRFYKGEISTSDKKTIDQINKESFLNYTLNWSEVSNVSSKDSLEEFYVLVNKQGKHLNTPELNKAEFANSKFLSLVEELLDFQELINLDLFTEAAAKRMNDRSFIEELVAYLKLGIGDKRVPVEKLFKEDISDQESESLRQRFKEVISIISQLSLIVPISKTRYKQRNDFYTFFNFINENLGRNFETYKLQYKTLVFIDPYISPSQEECEPLKEYAINCVSQSNSKVAREKRLYLFNSILKNTDIDKNEDFKLIVNFLISHTPTEINLTKVDEFQLLDLDKIIKG